MVFEAYEVLRMPPNSLSVFPSVSQQYKPLGMKNGRIPSRAITVSSKWDRYHGGNRARLQISRRGRYRGAWSAKHNNPYQWIKIDFTRPVKVLAVATQGRQDASQWVTRYYLTYSFDGINFIPYLCRKVLLSKICTSLTSWRMKLPYGCIKILTENALKLVWGKVKLMMTGWGDFIRKNFAYQKCFGLCETDFASEFF